MSNASNVSAGKPKVTGAIYVAPKGTALPVTPEEELSSAFENLRKPELGMVNSKW